MELCLTDHILSVSSAVLGVCGCSHATIMKDWAEINLLYLFFSVIVSKTCGWFIHNQKTFLFCTPPCSSGCWEYLTSCLCSGLRHIPYWLVNRNDCSQGESKSKTAGQGYYIHTVIACSEGNSSSLVGTIIILPWKQSSIDQAGLKLCLPSTRIKCVHSHCLPIILIFKLCQLTRD